MKPVPVAVTLRLSLDLVTNPTLQRTSLHGRILPVRCQNDEHEVRRSMWASAPTSNSKLMLDSIPVYNNTVDVRVRINLKRAADAYQSERSCPE